MTPKTDAMLQPVQGRDCVTGAPIDVVHADDCRNMERLLREAHRFLNAQAYEEDEIEGYCKRLNDYLGIPNDS
jgi:hypothetical protein